MATFLNLHKQARLVAEATAYSMTLVEEMTSTTAITASTAMDEDCGCDGEPSAVTAAVTDTRPEEIVSTALDEDPTTTGTETLAEGDAPPAAATRTRWAGVIGMEGEMTGDGRLIEHGALRWDISPENPAPIRYVNEDVGAHDGAIAVGVIDNVTRRDGGVLWGEGWFDEGSISGVEALRVVREEIVNGVSMDLDDVSFEIRVAAEILESMQPIAEGEEVLPESDADGRITVAELKSDDEVRVTTSGRVRAATIVAIPAFAGARIFVTDTEEIAAPDDAPVEDEALVASIGPKAAPADWFLNPSLSGPTALTVTKDGRVYGHIALWGTCHVSHGHGGKCITPPKSQTGYAGFHLGSYLTSEGKEIAVGHLTLGTGHAADNLGSSATVAHYDNTGTAVADVRAGEDGYGIWVAGAVDHDATDKEVRRLRSAPISGDWRRQGTSLELVAALAVNVPGFPVPRPSGLVASGHVKTLTAAGMLPPSKVARPGTADALSDEDLRYLKRLAAREREHEATSRTLTASALRQRVAVSSVRAHRPEIENKVRAFAAARRTTMTEETD